MEPKQEDRPDIDQFSITCTPLEKAETSLRLIRSQGYERVMIFCNTKHMCQRLCDEFQRAGLDCDCIHGDIRQSQREKTMQRYRDGKLAVLIATDVCLPGHRRGRCGLRRQLRRAGGERVLRSPHWPHRPGEEKGRGMEHRQQFPGEGQTG